MVNLPEVFLPKVVLPRCRARQRFHAKLPRHGSIEAKIRINLAAWVQWIFPKRTEWSSQEGGERILAICREEWNTEWTPMAHNAWAHWNTHKHAISSRCRALFYNGNQQDHKIPYLGKWLGFRKCAGLLKSMVFGICHPLQVSSVVLGIESLETPVPAKTGHLNQLEPG